MNHAARWWLLSDLHLGVSMSTAIRAVPAGT